MNTTNRYRATALQAVIKKQGRAVEWVAACGGVHPSLLTHLLRGRRTVSEDVAVRIADGLGVPLFLIFELSNASDSATRDSAQAQPLPA